MSSPSSDLVSERSPGHPSADRAVPLAVVRDEAQYGGKAVQLGAGIRAGLPVPPGLALPAALVAAVVAGDALAQQEVARARTALGDGPVAVRSSAVGEDSGGASFAGQHTTVLNAEDILAAVVEVAQSACQESATAYRARLGRPADSATGVVLQRLVAADVAGVLFTCDPLTGADELVIEASWSLGEAVVSGLVTPDLYRLAPDGALRSVRAGCKDSAVVPRAGGGTQVVAVDPARAARPCLTTAQLVDLAALAARVRQVWPGPSDLEWAFASGRLALLQRRPVTTASLAPS